MFIPRKSFENFIQKKTKLVKRFEHSENSKRKNYFFNFKKSNVDISRDGNQILTNENN